MALTNKPYDRVIEKFLLDNIEPNTRVIDVGCGTGWTALILANNKTNCSVDGVDINTLKIHRANTHFLKAKRDHIMHCHLCKAEELVQRFGASKFEYVVTNHSVHHFGNPLKVFKQIKAILKKGGKLLIGELTPSYGEKIDNCPRYSISKIRDFVEQSGLKLVHATVKQPGVILVVYQK